MVTRPDLSISGPDHYYIPEKTANKFQKVGRFIQQSNPISFWQESQRQHEDLRRIFEEKIGLNVAMIDAVPGLDDFVFEADSYILQQFEDGSVVIILSHFAHADRQREVEEHIPYLKKYWPHATIVQSPYNLEGTGDTTYDTFRGVYWSGYVSDQKQGNIVAGRSDPRAHKFLQDITGIPVIGLEMDNDFFHADTIIAPLPSGHIVVYPGGMTPESYELFKQRAFVDYGLDPDEYCIEVNDKDAHKYACNLQCFGDKIVMPECSQELQDRLSAIDYEVFTVDMENLIYSGGGPHCCSNRWDFVHAIGGQAAKIGIPLPPWYIDAIQKHQMMDQSFDLAA